MTSFLEALFDRHHDWRELPVIERAGDGWSGSALVIPPPQGSDLSGGMDIEEVKGEVTIHLDYSHIHLQWPLRNLGSAGNMWADPLAMIDAILSEEIVSSSGWINGELRVGSLREVDKAANPHLVPNIQRRRIRSWKGTFDRDEALATDAYPRGEMHGGGSPQLAVLTAEAAAEKYDGVSKHPIISNFNALESAALNHIANEYPDHKNDLIKVFSSCLVAKRENTGWGFYTDFEINGQVEMPEGTRSPLGGAWLSINGMTVGVCCLVHLKKGVPAILEGYSPAGKNTSGINFDNIGFKVESGLPT